MGLLDNPAGDLYVGRKVCTSAGTAEPIVSTPKSIVALAVQAELDNSGDVAVGNEDVVAANGSAQGILLAPGESMTLEIHELSKVYIDSKVSGDGVSFLYMVAS